jgi:photosystem II stability/assembly factor-like uncharacterized protein
MRALCRLFVFFSLFAFLHPPVPALSSERPVSGEEEEGEGLPPDRPLERAAWNARIRRDARGQVLAENRLRALAEACQLPVDSSMRAPAPANAGRPAPAGIQSFGGRRWQAVGPKPAQSIAGSTQRWGMVAGRVSAIAIHPFDESTLLMASATGGIWKSTDAGANWRPVSDGAPALATSHIAFAPSNPLIVYAATGEVDTSGSEAVPNQSFGTYLGAGLLRSGDGGETWSRVDLDLPGNAVLSRIVVSPSDPQTVLVGIYLYQDIAANGFRSGGVFRSTDGGVHFAQTFTHRISDMAQDPGDAQRVYLAAGRCPECVASGVYVSTDFGQTWSASLIPSTPGAGFTHPSGRIRIGLTRSAGATVLYASVIDANNEHTNAGIYRSGDGGATWTKKTADPTMCPKPPANNQCSYDHWITPAAGSDSTLYFGSIGLYKSTDGGSTWSKFVDPYNRAGKIVPVHPDQHLGVVSTSAPDTIYFCTDGGLYRSRDGGQTFENLNTTLTLAQFNGVALHPTNPDFAIGGTQDNGNLRYTGSPLWTDRTGGDGGFNLIESDSPSVILSGYYYALMTYSHDGAEGYVDSTPCNTLMNCSTSENLESMAFYPPMVAAPAAPATVFLGTNRIWTNPTFGADATKWTARGPSTFLTASADFLTALAVSGDGSGSIWAGSELEGVFFSSDGGATFSARSAGLPNAIVTAVVPATPDGTSAYATFGGFLGSPSRHVFRTRDAGMTWTNISGNLPEVPITSLVLDPSDPNDLFVGSDVGVLRSVDGGASWVTFNEGLPNAGVYALAFHRSTGDLWAATYGRGMFRILAPLLAPAADFSASPTGLFAGTPILFVDTSGNSPTSWAWNFGDPASGAANTSTSKNPRHTYAAPGVYTVTLIVTNSVGSNLITHTVTISAGGPCKRCSRVTPFR